MAQDQKIDQRIFDLYDEYCHGGMERREFLSPRRSDHHWRYVRTVDGAGADAALRRSADHLLHRSPSEGDLR